MRAFVKSIIKSPRTKGTLLILTAPFLLMLGPYIITLYVVVEKVFKKKLPDW